MSKWDKYAEAPASAPKSSKAGKWDKYAEQPVAAPAEEPGWFEPGSKSEAAARGFSQAATLGYGDEIQAGIRSLFGDEKYADLRDQERNANANAAATNPGSYLAGGVAASLPAGAAGIGKNLATTAGRSAALGAISGAGNSDATDASGMLADAAKGAAIQGTLGVAAKGIPMVPGKVAGALAPVLKDPTATGAALGAGTAMATGGNVVEGAVAGGIAGRMGRGPIGAVSKKLGTYAAKATASPGAKAPVTLPGALGMTGTTATTLALRNLSGQDARRAVAVGNQRIQEAVNAGQPAYAATFQQLSNNPAYRMGADKVVREGPESGPDTVEDMDQEDD